MRCFQQFEVSLGDIYSLADHALALLEEGSSEKRNIANTITRSGVVLLSGHLEGFVRELVEDAVDEINDLGPGVSTLPIGLVANALEATLSQSPPKRDVELKSALEMVRLDGKCLLDRKRLSNTRGNPSVDTIEELFAGFGFDSVVDDLSIKDFQIESTYIEENQSTSIESKIASALGANQQGALQEVLRVVDEKWKPKKRRRDVGYVSAIQELLKQRNRIAHGEGREPVTPQELKDHCAVIRQFGAGLNQLIDAMIDGLRARACASDETAAF